MLDWPLATVLLGTLATVSVGIMKWVPRRGARNGRVYARAVDLADIAARLGALEKSTEQFRVEVHSDLRGVHVRLDRLMGDLQKGELTR